MRERYLEKLEQLHKELLEMGLLCEKAIMKTYRLLLSEEERQELVTRIDVLEREIDAKERMIESICMQLFLQQQPVASDLRRITAALKLITDLERIGDQATDIAEIMQTGSVTVPIKDVRLTEMAEYTMNMVNKSVESYVQKDLSMAKEVIDSDDTLDNLFTEVRQEINRCSIEGQYTNDQAMDMLMISKYYERIGDHASDIGELVLLLVGESYILDIRNIRQMANETMDMVVKSIEAFVQKDQAMARWVIAHDDIVDDLFNTVKKELITLINQDMACGEQATDLLMAAKYFERIGDHSVNIAEWVIYSLTGRHVKENR